MPQVLKQTEALVSVLVVDFRHFEIRHIYLLIRQLLVLCIAAHKANLRLILHLSELLFACSLRQRVDICLLSL